MERPTNEFVKTGRLQRTDSISEDDNEGQLVTHRFSRNSISRGAKAHFGDVYYGEPIQRSSSAPTRIKHNATIPTRASPVMSLSSRVAYFFERRSCEAKVRRDLGPWAQEARNSQGQWLVPCLTRTAFKAHLKRHGGTFKTRRSCTSTLGWAKMLHELEIGPGQGVVTWKLSPRGTDPMSGVLPDLLMEGEVACHLINLFRREFRIGADDDRPGPLYTPPSRGNDYFRLMFGNVQLSKQDRNFSIFIEDIAASHSEGLSCELLRSNSSKALSGYLSAFETGISDSECVLPPSSAAFDQRAAALVRAMYKIHKAPEYSIAITAEWLEMASRIKRRLTKGYGRRQAFIELLADRLSSEAEGYSDPLSLYFVQDLVMSEDQAFSVEEPQPDHLDATLSRNTTQDINWHHAEESFRAQFEAAVSSLRNESENAWAQTLASMPDTVYRLLKLPHTIKGQMLLPFDSTHELWTADCRVLA